MQIVFCSAQRVRNRTRLDCDLAHILWSSMICAWRTQRTARLFTPPATRPMQGVWTMPSLAIRRRCAAPVACGGQTERELYKVVVNRNVAGGLACPELRVF